MTDEQAKTIIQEASDNPQASLNGWRKQGIALIDGF
jgi:hypothetical protein